MLSLPFFDKIYVVDFEFIAGASERNKPVCVVSHEIISGETRRLWLYGEENLEPPYSMGVKDLFIAHMSSAEWGCHLALGWTLPVNVIDTFVEYKAMINHSYEKRSASLLEACKAFGIDTISKAEKDQARDRILAGAPYSEEEKEFIMKYCESDVLETAELFKRMITVPGFNVPQALFRGEYMKPVAEIEYNGIPVDVPLLKEIQDNWEWMKIKLIQRMDIWGIYEGATFKIANFSEFVANQGYAWPLTDTGLPKTDKETFKEMAEIHSELKPLKDLKMLVGGLNFKSIMSGSDGRSRTLVSPYWTKTGRNAPKDDEDKKDRGELRSRFMFGLPASLRSLIKPEQGKVLAYIDYSQQEFFVAAVLSGDQNMIAAYMSGDPYLAFAKLAGAVPPEATKKTHPTERNLFKSCVLAVQYGMGAEALAFKIGKPLPYAKELLNHHKRVFKDFWKWRSQIWNEASLLKEIKTLFGWRMGLVGSTNKEMLTVCNFPIQAAGSDILRIACIKLSEAGFKIIAPVHDAVMIELDDSQNTSQEIEKAQAIMEEASEIYLGNGCRLKTDVDIISYPDRYIDEKAVNKATGRPETWDTIMQVLEEVKKENNQSSLININGVEV